MNNNNHPSSGGLSEYGRGSAPTKTKSRNLPHRYVIVFMGFLAFVNIYMMYMNLVVILPAMIDHNATELMNEVNTNEISNIPEEILKKTEEALVRDNKNVEQKVLERLKLNHDKIQVYIKESLESLKRNISTTRKPPSDVITVPKLKITEELTKEILSKLIEQGISLPPTTPAVTKATKTQSFSTQSSTESLKSTSSTQSPIKDNKTDTEVHQSDTVQNSDISTKDNESNPKNNEEKIEKVENKMEPTIDKSKKENNDSIVVNRTKRNTNNFSIALDELFGINSENEEMVKEDSENANVTESSTISLKLNESDTKDLPSSTLLPILIMDTVKPSIVIVKPKKIEVTPPPPQVIEMSVMEINTENVKEITDNPIVTESSKSTSTTKENTSQSANDFLENTSTEISLKDTTESANDTITTQNISSNVSSTALPDTELVSELIQVNNVMEDFDNATETEELSTEFSHLTTIDNDLVQEGSEDILTISAITEDEVMENSTESVTTMLEEIDNNTTELVSNTSERIETINRIGIPLDLHTFTTESNVMIKTNDSNINNTEGNETLISGLDTQNKTSVDDLPEENVESNFTIVAKGDPNDNVIENSSDVLSIKVETTKNTTLGTDAINQTVSLNHTISCNTLSYANCSFTGTYDAIDKNGVNETSISNDTWVTLRPFPTLDPHRIHLFNSFGSDEIYSKPRRLYNFTDHFRLTNCSRVNSSYSERDSDIECMSSQFGVIRLNIVDENDDSSSSSSSSSSSEEDSDEEDSDEEDEDEEGEEEDEDEEEEEYDRKGFLGRKGFKRRGFLNRRRKNKQLKENRHRKEANDEANGRITHPKFRNYNFNDEELQLQEPHINCEESSEECGDEGEEDDGEEGEEEEENENEIAEDPHGTSPIRLDEKIPSTVCFVKEIVSDVSFQFEGGEFTWEPHVQSRILSGYYWGFLISQIPAGRFAGVIGGKILLLVGVLMAGIITLLTPILASTGPYWLLAARVVLGMMQGVAVPATQSLLAQWAPPLERTKMAACTYSGIAIGAALGGPLCEYLVEIIGWKVIFYGQGVLALIWSLFWFFLVSDSPTNHPKISDKEKQLVLASIGQQHAGKNHPIPWCHILRSRHVLGLMLAHGAFMWAWHTILHYAPRYIATVLHRDRYEVQGVWGGALCSMFVMTCAYGLLADWLRKSRKTSTESIRRAANSICSLLGAAFLVGVAQSYCNYEAVKVCFAMAIAVGFPGAFSGIYVNSLDLAPNYAAAIAGICGAFATTANILSPFYWSLIVDKRSTLERWRTIWYTCAIFLLLANCLYFLLVGSKEQRWNRPVTLNKSPKRREEDQGAIPRRRMNYTHGIKNQAYASTEHL